MTGARGSRGLATAPSRFSARVTALAITSSREAATSPVPDLTRDLIGAARRHACQRRFYFHCLARHATRRRLSYWARRFPRVIPPCHASATALRSASIAALATARGLAISAATICSPGDAPTRGDSLIYFRARCCRQRSPPITDGQILQMLTGQLPDIPRTWGRLHSSAEGADSAGTLPRVYRGSPEPRRD